MDTPFQQSLASMKLGQPEERPVPRVVPGNRGYSFAREDLARPLWVLMALAGLVLLITCADVANLLLSRASSRSREAAMRAALGAGRARFFRQHLTESLLLAPLGGVGGLLVGEWCGAALLSLADGRSHPLVIDPRFDWRFSSFSLFLALATGRLFGLGPPFVPPARTCARVMAGMTRTSSWRVCPSGFERSRAYVPLPGPATR